jgi:hypothetical protein
MASILICNNLQVQLCEVIQRMPHVAVREVGVQDASNYETCQGPAQDNTCQSTCGGAFLVSFLGVLSFRRYLSVRFYSTVRVQDTSKNKIYASPARDNMY